MATNDYQTFGDGGTDGVDRLSLTNYTADADRTYGNGHTTKVIRSQLHNKVLQQVSKMSAALGQYLVNNGISALDTDSAPVLATKLGTALGGVVNTSTHAATSKATPVDADEIPLIDSAASFGLARLTWANAKATIKTYFDTVYANLASPAFTGTPTAPTATAGTNTTQLATTANVYASSLGWGQTWQNVTVSRASGTIYTNSTGKPIMVMISAGMANSNGSFFIDEIQMARQDYEASVESTMSIIVPSGATYRFTLGAGAISYWAELR